MKIVRGIFILSILLGLLSACGNDNTKVNNNKDVTNHDTVNETTNNNTTNAKNTTRNDRERTGIKVSDVNYVFTEFDLDVEYVNDRSYDVEYENDGNYIYAEIDDELNGVKYEGDQAYNNFADALKQLTFDKTTSDEDVRNEVLKAFALDENYQSFELEVRFQSGEEKHYHHNK